MAKSEHPGEQPLANGRDRQPSAPGAGSRTVHPILAGAVAVVGLLLTVGAVAAYGEYPTGLSTPFATVLGVLAVVAFGTAVIAFGVPRGEASRPRPTALAVAALVGGVASVVVFLTLIGAHLSLTSSPTIPPAGRWASVIVGGVSFVLGILGSLAAGDDGPSRRMSLAAALLGLGPALTAILLSSQNCYLFVDHASGCFGP